MKKKHALAAVLASVALMATPAHAAPTIYGSGDCAQATAVVYGLGVDWSPTHRHVPGTGKKFYPLQVRRYEWNVYFTFSYSDGSVVKVSHFGNGLSSATVTISAPNPGAASSVVISYVHRATTLEYGRHWGSILGPELPAPVNETGAASVDLNC